MGMNKFVGPRPGSKRRRGGALILATIAVSVVAVITTCLLQIVGASSRREQGTLDIRRAFYLAEAGLAEAYSGVRIGKTGNVGTPAVPAVLDDGLFWVTATDLGEDRLDLECTAMCGVGRAALSMVVEKGEQSVATLGMFSSLSLDIPPGSTIQGFDSSAEGPGPTLATGRLGSNEDIAATGRRSRPTVIRADLYPGPGRSANLGPFVTHEGEIETRNAAVPLPAVVVPFEPTDPGIDHRDPIPLILPSGDVGLAFLSVSSDSQVIAQGPCNLVVNDLVLAPGASLEFNTNLGPVRLFVRRSLTMNERSQVSCSGTDPSQLIVQLPSGSPALLSPTGELYGVVYAPAAQVTIGSELKLHGSVVARRLVLSPGARLFFDQHLDETASEAQIPKMISWRIVELETTATGGGVKDPFERLGLDPRTLPRPANAHQDQVLDLVYEDLSGAVNTYTGPESGFDWTGVLEVEVLSRDGEDIAVPPPDPGAPPITPPSPALLAIRDVNLSSSALRTRLISLAPLTTGELIAAIARFPGLQSGHLKDVLLQHAPLGSAELMACFDRPTPMDSSDLEAVLRASSPLPDDVIARVITDGSILSSSDRQSVLSLNGITSDLLDLLF